MELHLQRCSDCRILFDLSLSLGVNTHFSWWLNSAAKEHHLWVYAATNAKHSNSQINASSSHPRPQILIYSWYNSPWASPIKKNWITQRLNSRNCENKEPCSTKRQISGAIRILIHTFIKRSANITNPMTFLGYKWIVIFLIQHLCSPHI